MSNLDELALQIQETFTQNQTIKSFQQFIEDVKKDPRKYTRGSAEYLKDVFDHFGSYQVRDITGHDISRWGLFDLFYKVVGQERAQNQIYGHLCSFSENRVNKVILLHGPNGSSKTSLISSIMAAAEAYSKTSEGALYTFNWIFSDVGDKEVGLGFGETKKIYNQDTLAFTASQDVTFKLPCSLKDNPLLIIPVDQRKAFFNDYLGMEVPKNLEDAELCPKCKEIFDQLLINYKGDWKKLIRHIQVERLFLSKRFRRGVVSIEAQKSVDAGARPLNLEQSYRIPHILSLSSLHEPYGDLIDANRGLVEFSEIFKRHPETNKYLLTTAEWGTVSLPGMTAYLDCVIFATDNESNLAVFKYDPDWPSFNGRFAYVRVPYLLQWSLENKIYKSLLSKLTKNTHVAPHVPEIISLWTILTRLRKSKHSLAKNLSHVQKAVLYDTGQAPDSWKEEERKLLLKDLEKITMEFEESQDKVLNKNNRDFKDTSYEGRSGASYREVEAVVVAAIHNKNYNFLSPVAIFQAIEDICRDKTVYDFLRLPENAGYLDAESALNSLKEHYVTLVKRDLREAADLVASNEYLKLFERYIQHIKADIYKEKIFNDQTQAWDSPDDQLLNSVESLLKLGKSDIGVWRNNLINKIGDWAIKNKGTVGQIPYQELFSEHLEKLKNAISEKHQDQLNRIKLGILKRKTEDWDLLSDEDKESVEKAYQRLLDKGYSEESLKEAIVQTIRY